MSTPTAPEPAELDDLVSLSQLEGFRGGPFTEIAVGAAGDEIRGACHWHIAPVITETQTVDSDGTDTILLRSLRVLEVLRVVDRRSGAELTGWEWSSAGLLQRADGGGWPAGLRRLSVELRHGHESVPRELLAVAAKLTRQLGDADPLIARTTGGVTTRYRDQGLDGVVASVEHVLARYRVTST